MRNGITLPRGIIGASDEILMEDDEYPFIYPILEEEEEVDLDLLRLLEEYRVNHVYEEHS